MKNLSVQFYTIFMTMPLGLRLLTVISMGGSLFLFSAVPLPGQSFHVNEREVSYIEWILMGYGLVISTTGALFLASVVGFFKRKGWGRLCFLLAPTVMLLLSNSIIEMLSGLGSILVFWSLPLGFYLFRRENVRTYFSQRE